MTVARPGDPFHLDLQGTVLDGHYLEVDPPYRLLLGWDHPGTDESTPTPALAEITLTPTVDGTSVNVTLTGLAGDEADFQLGLWMRHLNRIADVFAGTGPGELLDD